MSKKSCNLSVHDKILSGFTILTAHFFGNNDKNGEKNTHRDQSSTAQILFRGRMFSSIPRKIGFGEV